MAHRVNVYETRRKENFHIRIEMELSATDESSLTINKQTPRERHCGSKRHKRQTDGAVNKNFEILFSDFRTVMLVWSCTPPPHRTK